MRSFKSLAWRNIRSRPLRAGLNAIGIVLGVGLVFAVTALSTNLVNTFDSLFDSVYGETDIIVSTTNSAGLLPDGTLEKVQATDGVEDATGLLQSLLTLVKNGKASDKPADRMFVAGVDPGAGDYTGAEIVKGRDIEGGDEIVVDKTFADKQGLEVGDAIEAAAPAGLAKFELVGINRFKNDFSFGGQGIAAIPLTAARELFDQPRGFNEIDVKVAGNAGDIADVKEDLQKQLGEGADVATPKDLGDEIGDALQGFSVVLGFFAGIAVFVGGFLILNSFAMTIAQRIREIGMLRTMGADRRQVTRSILVESLMLGVIGTILGLALGLLLTQLLVAMVESFGVPFNDVTYPTRAFVLAAVIGIAATLVAAWQPARRAGRASPMEAVNEETAAQPPKTRQRAAFGFPMMLLGLGGAYVLVTSSDASTPIVATGIGGIFLLFTGAILVAPIFIPLLSRVLAPLMRIGGRLEGRIAIDNVVANTKRSAATASILMVGIAMVATFGTVASSSLATIKKQLDETFKSDFTVQPIAADQGGGPQPTISPAVAKEIAKTPGVAVASPQRTLFVSDGWDDTDNFVAAIDPATAAQVQTPDFVGASVDEALQGLADGGVAISQSYAQPKGIEVGDTITIDGLRGQRRLKVVALDPTAVQATVGLLFSLKTADELFGLNQDSSFGIKLEPGADIETTRSAIERELERYPQLELKSTAELKADIERQQSQGLSFFYALMFVAILIGLFGVMNTMFISVIERTREVGVLRAIGAKRRQVRKVVRRESIILAVCGTVMGLAVGLVLGFVFFHGFFRNIENAVYAPPVGIIILSAILSVIFGVLAAGLPARRAARINVVEAVSYE
jgi:putative ABC transport system permease protein